MASGRLQSPDGGNNRGGTAGLCCRRQPSCPFSSPCPVPHAPCGDATREVASNSRVLVSQPCLFLNLHKVMYASDHAANRGRVLMFDHLVHAAKTEAANRLPHAAWAADKTHHPFDLQRSGFFLCRGHFSRRAARKPQPLPPLPCQGIPPPLPHLSNEGARRKWPLFRCAGSKCPAIS